MPPPPQEQGPVRRQSRWRGKFARLPENMDEMVLLTRQYNVGIFDSGIGGLSVVRELLARRPDLNLLYIADYANLPFGDKHPGKLAELTGLHIDFLMDHDADFIAMGCNSCNSVMGKGMLNCFDIQVFDLVTSTIDTLPYLYPPPEKLLILGTQVTIDMMYWRREFEVHYPEIELREQAAPELVPLLELREPDEAALRMYLRKHIGPHYNDGFRAILLACTHFVWLMDMLDELFPGLELIDPAVCLANVARNALELPDPQAGEGTLKFFLTRESERFAEAASDFFGRDIRPYIELIDLSPDEESRRER